MASLKTNNDYLTTIGIECHVQLKTATKLFAGVGNDAREAPPNTLVSHICFGMPGALPVLNEQVIALASKAAFALNTRPEKFSKFDRKHYFYPDLPKGYQITQFTYPIIAGGSVKIHVNGEDKKIGITRAHIEEDAGKSTHPVGKDYSLVDLNRAGTPLLEIVSEPDMHSAAEAGAYVRELYLRMKYADVSDANLYYGNMRFDVNVSVSKDHTVLGTRSETKNLNSFKSVEKAVDYEVRRQIELLEKGQKVVQETRGWNDTKQKTFSQRSKEDAHDYRYFPEPDLPPVLLTEEYINEIEKKVPVMPEEWRVRLSSLGLDKLQTELLLDAEVEDPDVSYLLLIETNLPQMEFAKKLVNWLINVEIPFRHENNNAKVYSAEDRSKMYRDIFALVSKGDLSSTNAKALIEKLLGDVTRPPNLEIYAKEYIQVSDDNVLVMIVDKVLADNPKAAADVKNGENKAIGFLVGQVMKESKGKANPGIASELIRRQLGV
jgi:aspartyl-tRNA(Asn)/glutamyl-tRNA(Gln) amidotransferase subunit B